MGVVNVEVLEGLVGGVNVFLFIYYYFLSFEELEILFKDIEFNFILVYFVLEYLGKDFVELFCNLIYYMCKCGLDLSSIKGFMDFDLLFDWVELFF